MLSSSSPFLSGGRRWVRSLAGDISLVLRHPARRFLCGAHVMPGHPLETDTSLPQLALLTPPPHCDGDWAAVFFYHSPQFQLHIIYPTLKMYLQFFKENKK